MRTILIIAVFLLTPSAVTGQVVRGTLVDEVTAAPVEGAMVVLLNPDGPSRASALSDEQGRFVLHAPAPGAWRLRVDRIGHASIYSDEVMLAAEDTASFTLELPIDPVHLEGIHVQGSRRCVVRPGQGVETARLWEEVRKALAAAAWTDLMQPYHYRLTHFLREFEPGREWVGHEQQEQNRGFWRAPFESLPADDLIENGFVRRGGGGLIYSAPDAHALLSDAFLDTHCFRVEGRGRSVEDLVGLAFEPVPGRRDVPEIKGVLWVDPRTSELRRLEYEYTHLGTVDMAAGEGFAGGTIVFEAMPNGTWIIREWSVRMPIIDETWVQLPEVSPGGVRGLKVVAIREEGARVDEIRELSPLALAGGSMAGPTPGGASVPLGVGGDTIAPARSAPTGLDALEGPTPQRIVHPAAEGIDGYLVRGSVRTRAQGDMIGDAFVEVLRDSTQVVAQAVANEAGRFRIVIPAAGQYRVRVSHIGYRQALSGWFSVGDMNEAMEVDVDLAVDPVLLPPVEIGAQRASERLEQVGFYERQARGLGQFIVPEVEGGSAQRVTDLLRGRPGVQVISDGSQNDVIMSGATTANVRGACWPTIVLDRLVIRPGGVGAVVGGWGGTVHPSQIDGIEIYTGPAGLPVQFGGNRSPCGAIVIWTSR